MECRVVHQPRMAPTSECPPEWWRRAKLQPTSPLLMTTRGSGPKKHIAEASHQTQLCGCALLQRWCTKPRETPRFRGGQEGVSLTCRLGFEVRLLSHTRSIEKREVQTGRGAASSPGHKNSARKSVLSERDETLVWKAWACDRGIVRL